MSSDEELDLQPKPKRQKRFKFKTFEERVADVEVDVYRSLGAKRAEPLPGCSSFFQEGLAKWRELNSAEHWLAAAAELNPLTASLAQLVHHRDEIAGILLGCLRMEALLSLEPALELTGTLARDLQGDYLPLLPSVLAALADLVDEGLDREPEQLQHLFACLSLICKHLCKLLASEAQLLSLLKASQRLRHHRAEHVRALAAESLGFLFRQASGPAIRVGVKAALAEAVTRPTDERVHAAGALLAEAVTGVSHGLHSRAAVVLGPVLCEGVLRPEDFKSAKSQAGGKLNQEAIQARVAAALSVCIEQLAQHTRRGKCGELWKLLLAEVDTRLEALVAAQQRQQQLAASAGAEPAGEAAAPATGSKKGKKGGKSGSKAAAAAAAAGAEAGQAAEAAAEEVKAAAASAARGIALLAQLVEHGRGCRVEAYEPLFRLAARLVKPEFLGSGSSSGGGSGGRSDGQPAGAADGEPLGVAPLPHGASAVPSDFLQPSLSAQVLRLLLALALSHAKVAGASEGPAALAKAAPAWAPAFVRAPPAELMPFIRSLISYPGGADVARPFSQQMLGVLGRCLLAGELSEVCWPLLMDVCATLRPGATAGAAGVPIILTASGVGAQLASLVRSKLQAFDRQAAGDSAAAAEAWAALACLPHAAESAAQAAACCAALAAATEPSEGEDEQAAGPGSDSSSSSSALLMLHCGALGTQAALLAAAGEERGQRVQAQLLPQALALLVRHPGNYHAVAAAATVLQAASAAGAELSQQQLQELLPLLAPNLSAASQPLRRETLRVLCCFSQPAMQTPAGAEEPPKDAPAQPCDALQQLLVLESRQQGVDGGRPSVVALGRMRNYLEYRRLPDWLVPAVIHELLGVLHIRFAALWNPAHDALGMALDQYPSVAWPLMHRQLAAAQEAFLGGDCFARPVEATAAAAAAAAGQHAAAPPLLGPRFVAAAVSGEEAAAGGSTDAAVRLNHLLKAMAAANNNVVESKARDWVPLFLGFTAANPTAAATEDGDSAAAAAGPGAQPPAAEDSEEDDDEPAAGSSGQRQQQRYGSSGPLTGRAWRSGLREWLALLGGLKGARGMFQWEAVQRAVAVQLMDVDPAIQTGALKCLKVFKLKFLLPYLDRLLRLADNKTLREELTAFPLAISVTSLREDEGSSALLPEHRAGLVPLLVRLLFPKMRKRSGRLGGKGAPGSARAAILNFLAAAEPHELRPLLELFLAPLSAAFVRPEGEAGQRELEALVGQDDPDAYRLIEGPWWGRCLGRQPGAWWLAHIDAAALNAEPLRKRIGYLNTLEDLLKHLGHRMQIFLPELLALAVCLLEGGVQPLLADGAAVEEAAAAAGDLAEGAKEVRSRSLRLAAAVLERFPTSCDYRFLWPRLLAATQPLLPRLAAESAADKAPPLVELAAALAASQHLVPVLADGTSAAIPAAAARQLSAEQPQAPDEVQPCSEAWAAGGSRMGSSLLAHCIGALSAPRCSEPSRIAMLGALESIFDLPDPLPQQVLGPHMPALLQGLQSIVVAVWQHGPGGGRSATAGRKGGRGRGAASGGQPAGPRTSTASRALAILELVGSRVASWEAAQQLTGALLPLLQPREGAGGRRGKQRRGDELLVSRTLAVLAALWSRLPGAELEQRPQAGEQLLTVAAVLAPLAGSLDGRDSRQALCAAYTSVAGLLSELAEPAALLTELNALSTTEIDELDYERRMAAYSRLTPAAWQPLSMRQAAPLLHTCLHDLRNGDDLALRHAASQAVLRFIEGAAAATESAEAAAGGAADATEGGSLLSAAQRVLFPQLKRGLPAPNLAVRQEHLVLLRQLVLAFPSHYAELLVLTDKDAEVDFLLNVAHIQLHRRARALVRLTKLLKRAGEDPSSPAPLGVGTLVGVVQPLLLQMVVEGKGGEEGSGGHELKQADKDRGANVTDAAVVALGAVAGALPWVQYQQLLGQHLRLMKRHADDSASKAVIRSVCAILDAFHFPLPDDLDEAQLAAEAAEAAALAAQEAAAAQLAAAEAEAAEGAEKKKKEEAETAEAGGEAEEAVDDEELPDAEVTVPGADVAAAPAQQAVPAGEVYRMLAKRVVPELQRIMVDKETVRAPVALAVVKVLQLLPAAAMRFQLPRTLQKVANLLRVRLQSIRDAARAVLVSMVKQLGPDYLPFVCEVLQSACPPKGFTAHVLGYTINAVIEAVAQVGQPGCLDDSLLMILPLMEADLFGEVAEAKEAVEFAGAYKEAKKCRAYETYQLLAGLITFGERAAELLTTVQSRLGEASQPKTRTKLAQLLQHAARGVLGNPTATAEDICMFFFATADSGLAAEEAARDKAKAASGAAVPTGKGGDDGGERAAALHQHLLVEFALSLLQGALKKGIINPRGPGADELLDPLLPLLVRALRSRHAPSVTTALQALTLLMQSQLPGLQKTAADAGKAVTELLKRCPKTSHPIAQDCFKLLGGMLRQCERWAPSQGQLRFLVTWAFGDLEETAGRQNAFHLLKAILARKLVLPEVYDLMNRVQELMVQSQAAPVRSACSSALLQFLLDYPLGEKRLQQHLQFLLTNLSYEHESGREAALDMLGVVLQKFPEQLVAQWAEMVFLPLVARLVNDPSAKCRQMVGACLSTLLRRAPPARRDRLAQFCGQWLGGADARLTRAAAQALGILAEVEGASFGRRVPALLPQLADVLASRAEQDAAAAEAAAVAERGEAEDLLAAAPGWQEAYYSLLLLQRVLEATAVQLAWAAGPAVQRCWGGAQRLLLHRHQWVRKASGRLVGAGLAAPAVGPPMLEASGAGAAGALALSFFRQLDSEAADDALSGQAVKCLVFLCTAMYDDDAAAGRLPPPLKMSGAAVTGGATGGEEDGGANGHAAAGGDDAEQEGSEDEEEAGEEGGDQQPHEEAAAAAGGSDSEGEEEEGDAEEAAAEASAADEAAAGSLTLHGLVRRMARLADDKTYARQLQRGIALRFIAAVASRLGAERVLPYLPLLMRPLYRITEPGAAGNPEEVTSLADEIVAHLRTLVGADAMLAAYNQAREAVRRQRGERKRKAALQTLVDPEAAAKRKIRKQQRKAAGKRKQMEHVKRLRAAGVTVKNKKQRTGDERGGGRRGRS